MVLPHQIVQVLAGSNLDATRKFAVCWCEAALASQVIFVGTRVFFIALRRNDLAVLTSRFRLRKKSTVWPALSTARLSFRLYSRYLREKPGFDPGCILGILFCGPAQCCRVSFIEDERNGTRGRSVRCIII